MIGTLQTDIIKITKMFTKNLPLLVHACLRWKLAIVLCVGMLSLQKALLYLDNFLALHNIRSTISVV